MADRPSWLTEEWRLAVPEHFLPARARLPLPPVAAVATGAEEPAEIYQFGGGGGSGGSAAGD